MPSTQDKIRELVKEIEQLKLVNAHYTTQLAELESQNQAYEVLETRLIRLYEEIESLESKGITAMFHSIIGNKEKRLEKARSAYYEVNLECVNLKKSIDALEYELEIVSRKADHLEEKERELSSLLDVREEELREEDSIQGKRLRKLLGEISENDHRLQLTGSIINSGKLTMKKVTMTILALREAFNLGPWEKTGKKRPKLRGYHRKRAISDAKHLASEAIRALDNFEKDLAGIGVKFQAEELDMKSFNTILDVFLDNMIADFIFQQKSQKNLAILNRIADDVKSALVALEKEYQNFQNMEQSLMDTKEKLLMN